MVQTESELEGLVVLDFCAFVAGAFCTRLLARWGAEVIKVESLDGDHLRTMRPLREGHSAYFGALNAGKRSVSLNLREPEGRDAALALVDRADIVMENFRPGVMDRLGLGYEAVSARRPDIVYGSVSGYGQQGPWVTRPALAAVVHATSGYDLAVRSYQDGVDRPQATGVHVADFLSASLALGGLMIALRTRDRTGVGRHVDVSMLDSVLSLLPGEVVSSQFPGDHNLRAYPPSRTRDGFVMIAAVSQPLFESLMRAIGRPELIDDDRFRTNSDRWINTRALDAIVEAWSSQRTGEECERVLLEAGVPASRYRTVAEQFGLEQTRVRGTFAEVADPAGDYRIVDSPFRFREPGQQPPPPASGVVPELGADTWNVLGEALGLEATQRLISAGIARAVRPPAETVGADSAEEGPPDAAG